MLIPKVEAFFDGNLQGKTIAIWGLSFKPYTDDIREAPSLYNIEELIAKGAKVQAYDPEGMENVEGLLGDTITYCKDEYQALKGADALMIMTEWPIFRTPDFDRIGSLLSNKVIFDGRNLYDQQTVKEMGFTYYSIGRGHQ